MEASGCGLRVVTSYDVGSDDLWMVRVMVLEEIGMSKVFLAAVSWENVDFLVVWLCAGAECVDGDGDGCFSSFESALWTWIGAGDVLGDGMGAECGVSSSACMGE